MDDGLPPSMDEEDSKDAEGLSAPDLRLARKSTAFSGRIQKRRRLNFCEPHIKNVGSYKHTEPTMKSFVDQESTVVASRTCRF
jgi:hypothetical protein